MDSSKRAMRKFRRRAGRKSAFKAFTVGQCIEFFLGNVIGRGPVRMVPLFYSRGEVLLIGFMVHTDSQRRKWSFCEQQRRKTEKYRKGEVAHIGKKVNGVYGSRNGSGPPDGEFGAVGHALKQRSEIFYIALEEFKKKVVG